MIDPTTNAYRTRSKGADWYRARTEKIRVFCESYTEYDIRQEDYAGLDWHSYISRVCPVCEYTAWSTFSELKGGRRKAFPCPCNSKKITNHDKIRKDLLLLGSELLLSHNNWNTQSQGVFRDIKTGEEFTSSIHNALASRKGRIGDLKGNSNKFITDNRGRLTQVYMILFQEVESYYYFAKVGATSKSVKDRFKGTSDLPYNILRQESLFFEFPEDTVECESFLLKECAKKYGVYCPQKVFCGKGECVNSSPEIFEEQKAVWAKWLETKTMEKALTNNPPNFG